MTPKAASSHRRLTLAALWLALVVWLLLESEFAPWATRVFPRAWQRAISYPSFLLLCQIAVLACGVFSVYLLTRKRRSPFALRGINGWAVALAVIGAPLLFAVVAFVAVHVAEARLMQELAQKGPGATRRAAGRFGQMLEQSPLLTTLLWASAVAALAEEFLFRGLFWWLIEQSGRALRRDARSGTHETSGAMLRSSTAWVATLLTTLVFGLMHWDFPGALGLVRAVSATGLGFACGTARQFSGSIWMPVILHLTYNAIGVGFGRGWWITSSFPLVDGMPTLLLAVGSAGLAALAMAAFAARVIAERRARALAWVKAETSD